MRTDAAPRPDEALRPRLGHARSLLGFALVVLVLVGWAVALRPQSLGGPAEYVLVSGTSMLPGLRNGDLVVVREAASYERGDVVSYRVPKGDPAAGLQVIHRIIGGGPRGFDVQGDNRDLPDLWRPTEADIVGKRWVRIPYAGHGLVFFRSPAALASLAAALVATSIYPRGRRKGDEQAP